MENLASSAKYLSEKGLSVILRSNTHLLVQHKGDRSLDLTLEKEAYRLLSWEYVPGPGEDDFSFHVPTLDEALLTTWCFYFAEPIEISGWVLPLHRRPYWPLTKFQYRLANAVHATAEQLESIVKTRKRRMLAQISMKGSRLAFAEHTQFILAGTHRDSGERLLVRRDLEEAYVLPAA